MAEINGVENGFQSMKRDFHFFASFFLSALLSVCLSVCLPLFLSFEFMVGSFGITVVSQGGRAHPNLGVCLLRLRRASDFPDFSFRRRMSNVDEISYGSKLAASERRSRNRHYAREFRILENGSIPKTSFFKRCCFFLGS